MQTRYITSPRPKIVTIATISGTIISWSELTIEAWFKPTKVKATTAIHQLIIYPWYFSACREILVVRYIWESSRGKKIIWKMVISNLLISYSCPNIPTASGIIAIEARYPMVVPTKEAFIFPFRL
ncbi:putative membrane protein [Dehalococcoides mccartyi DCMB5]|nr:putative membrane protein [Dehalococcoides mccartyi DCMB5]